MSFASLKKASVAGNTFAKLTQEIEKINQPQTSGGPDERFWKPEMDKSGNGYAVIRFLPAPDGEDMPWAKVWSHAFKGPGGQWYIENCPTTIGRKCSCCENNTKDWSTGDKQIQNIVRDRKRKLSYYANVYIIKDPDCPQNEGTVRIFKFGKKIFEKIDSVLRPKFQDDSPLNPFDFWTGADFKIKVLKKDGYWNYDSSEFSTSSPLLGGDDDALKEIYEKLHDISEFVNPNNFKSNDELQARLDKVLGNLPSVSKKKKLDPEVQDEMDREYQEISSKSSKISSNMDEDDSDEDAENALDYFQRLSQM